MIPDTSAYYIYNNTIVYIDGYFKSKWNFIYFLLKSAGNYMTVFDIVGG